MRIGRWTFGQGRGAAAALLVSLAGAGFSAHAGLDRGAVPTPTPVVAPTGYEAQDHFPGAALLYVDTPLATPAKGVTGTVELPAEPAGAAMMPMLADASIRPAAPWVLRGTPLDQARALQCLTTAIYYEAASEPDDGQAAVAQVILNRARHPSFPGTVCGVVYQGSERRGCQFSFACDGALTRLPMRAAWDRARRTAARALAGYVFAGVGMATHYHTYAVTPSWNRGLVMTGVFGAHFFHRWKGWWGTPAAFSRAYAGGEPLPGPHAPTAEPPLPLAVPAPVAIVAAKLLRITPPTEIQPDHAASGTFRPEALAAGDSQILDKWKDVGKPLR